MIKSKHFIKRAEQRNININDLDKDVEKYFNNIKYSVCTRTLMLVFKKKMVFISLTWIYKTIFKINKNTPKFKVYKYLPKLSSDSISILRKIVINKEKPTKKDKKLLWLDNIIL